MRTNNATPSPARADNRPAFTLVPQAIDGATFLVEAEERRPWQSADLARQIPKLIGGFDVAAKEDHGPRRVAFEDVPFFGT